MAVVARSARDRVLGTLTRYVPAASGSIESHPLRITEPTGNSARYLATLRIAPARPTVSPVENPSLIASPTTVGSAYGIPAVRAPAVPLREECPVKPSPYGTPGPARSYRPDLVGRWPRPGSRRTVPVPSHCRQSSTLIPMRSSAGQSAVALRGTHMRRLQVVGELPVAGAFVADRLDWLCCDGGCRGHVDCSDPLFGRRLRAGAAPQGRGEVEPVRVAAGAYHGRLGQVDQEGPATG